ncbi:MAG: hypothetical protein ACE5GW_04660 [Planctomycetota bacterium]
MERLLEAPLYPALYLATLSLHLAVISFPLGGAVILPLLEPARGSAAEVLRDVIRRPLALSIVLAITAGVAPLLFLQVLYPEAFCAAGAILGLWRPCLVAALAIAIILACLVRSALFRRWSLGARLAVELGILLSLGAVGMVFTISRQLGERADLWRERAADADLWSLLWSALPGGAMVLLSAVVGCGVWVLWLLRRSQKRGQISPGERFAAEETVLWICLPLTLAITGGIPLVLGDGGAPLLRRGLIVASALTAVGFALRLRRLALGRLLATAAALCALAGILLVREARRVDLLGEAFDPGSLAAAAEKGGIVAFIVCTLLSAGAIAWTVRIALWEPDGDTGASAGREIS